jgi:predicted LPLAT superfamily acyltransferase
MKKEWSGKTKGGNFGQKSLIFYFRHGSVTLSYFVLAIIVPFFMLFARKGYSSIYSYFRKIHSYGVARSFIMTYRNHYLFGQSMFDKYALFCNNGKKYELSFDGREAFDQALTNNQGIIIISSHCGNFELAGYILKQDLKKINAIAFGGESQVYQQARVNSLSENNISLIPVSDDFSHIYAINEALSKGEILIVPGDRVYEGSKVVERSFLGHEAKFPAGPFHLAEKYDARVFAIFVMKVSDFHYKTIVRSISDLPAGEMTKPERIEAMADKYIRTLESVAAEYPSQWYNFYKFWEKV